MNTNSKKLIFILLIVLVVGVGVSKSIFAKASTSVSYVPLIGITSVPEPLTLPNGTGNVTYHYAVKNFLTELDLTDVQVTDNKCSPAQFVGGDDNGDSRLNYSETWRYDCTTKVSTTTESIATATGVTNGIMATHSSYATVVVGSKNPAPLVSIVNITKVAYPLSLPAQGGPITFTYRVNNPGTVPLGDVTVMDNKCPNMSQKLGDTNGNNFLDSNEVWVYTCTAVLKQTTTNIATVTAFANGLKTTDYYTLTVRVDAPVASAFTKFPDLGLMDYPDLKIPLWGILLGMLVILAVLVIVLKL